MTSRTARACAARFRWSEPTYGDAALGLIAAASSLWLWARILGVPHV